MKPIDSSKVAKKTTYRRRFTRIEVLRALGAPEGAWLKELGGDYEGHFEVVFEREEEVGGFE